LSTRESSGTRTVLAAAVVALGLARPEITRLAGGVANRSFRLREGREDLVLKLTGGTATRLGASRRAEYAMQALAAGAGLAPAVVLADPAGGFIVSRHVEGRVPSARDFVRPSLLGRTGAWIARLHALRPPAGLSVVDFGERAAGYLARVLDEGPDPFVSKLVRELGARRAALPVPAHLVACHHDLHHRNIIDLGRRLLVVDWEYAGPGDPAADLAACIGYHELGTEAVEVLLAGYGDAGAQLRARIAALTWIFDCLWFGWNEAAALAGFATDPGEQARLAARLAH
jgi:aminoglycoside phosphotransferase (APT) family kinase protein